MAYLPTDPNQDDPNAKNQNGSQQAPVLGAPSAGASLGGSTGGTTNPSSTNSSSGQYTNLNAYVNANQGTDAAMGQAVKGVVDNSAGQADNAGSTFQQNAETAIGNGTVQRNDTLINQINTDPTKVTKADVDTATNATYGGPSQSDIVGTSDYQGAKNAYNTVEQQAKAASQGSLTDRAGLLSQAYARPEYTQGEQNLDSFITGAGQAGRAQLDNIGNTYGKYGDNFNKAVTGVNNDVTTAITNSTNNAAAVGNAVKTGLTNAQTGLTSAQGQADTANTTNTNQFNSIEGLLKSGKPTDRAQAYKALNIDPSEGEYLQSKGVDLGKLVTGSGIGLTAGDFLTAQQQANYKALMNLSGKDLDPTQIQASNVANTPYTVNTNLVDAGNSLKKLDSGFQSGITAANQKRNAEFTDPNNTFGLSADQLAQAKSVGLSPSLFYGGSQNATLADVVTQPQLQQYNQLANLLGIGALKEGQKTSGPTFDSKTFNSVLADRLAAKQQEAAEAHMVPVAPPPAPKSAMPQGLDPTNLGVGQAIVNGLSAAPSYLKKYSIG